MQTEAISYSFVLAERTLKYFITNNIDIKSIHSGANYVVILTKQNDVITFGKNNCNVAWDILQKQVIIWFDLGIVYNLI